MKHTSRILTILLAVLMVLSVAACGSNGGSTENTGANAQNEAKTETQGNAAPDGTATEETGKAAEAAAPEKVPHGGIVNLSIGRNPGEFFTPYKAGVVNSYGWVTLEPLAWKKTDGNYYPVLAESWEMNNEEHTLTVKLRDGITFSNGDPFDAEDVVFTHTIRNEYGTQTVIGSPEKIEALDKLTVKFTWPNFGLNYEQMVLPQYIYSKETYDEMGLDWMLNHMIGTGPYVLDEYIPDVGLTFSRNENYWGEKTPGPDGFKWSVIPDATASMAAFLNGELDALPQVQDANIMSQLEKSGYEGYVDPTAMTFCCQVQIITKDPADPLSNADVRAAIYNGIDWDDLALTVVGPAAYHTDLIGSTSMTYYKEEIEKSSFDLEGAKKALADLGYANGFDTVIYGASSDAPAMTYMQAALKALGINAEVVTVDASLRGSDYVTGKAIDSGFVFSGYGFVSSNTMDRFNKFISPDGTWSGGVTFSQDLIDLWEKVKSAKTIEEQNELLYQYCDMYVNQYHYMFPAYNSSSRGYRQDWYHQSDLANGGNGNDPFEIWVDEH